MIGGVALPPSTSLLRASRAPTLPGLLTASHAPQDTGARELCVMMGRRRRCYSCWPMGCHRRPRDLRLRWRMPTRVLVRRGLDHPSRAPLCGRPALPGRCRHSRASVPDGFYLPDEPRTAFCHARRVTGAQTADRPSAQQADTRYSRANRPATAQALVPQAISVDMPLLRPEKSAAQPI